MLFIFIDCWDVSTLSAFFFFLRDRKLKVEEIVIIKKNQPCNLSKDDFYGEEWFSNFLR